MATKWKVQPEKTWYKYSGDVNTTKTCVNIFFFLNEGIFPAVLGRGPDEG